MSAIRIGNAQQPYSFRFPLWEPDIFYPAGTFLSIMVVTDSDNELFFYNYYVAKKDIEYDNNESPLTNTVDYRLFFTTNNSFDSDMNALTTALANRIDVVDAWIDVLTATDSDIRQFIDSEIRERISNDSDIKRIIDEVTHINFSFDSDVDNIRHGYKSMDSDIIALLHNTIHDMKAGDSDLRFNVTGNLDSDILQTKHDYKAADSDIRQLLTSGADSDIRQTKHDYKAADSDIVNVLVADIDSDITTIYHDYRAADSDLRRDIDSDGITIRHDYKAADSDIVNTLVKDIDSDIAKVRHDVASNDSDIRRDLDSEVRVIVHDYLASDSDTALLTTADHDSDLKVIRHDYKAADSDLRIDIDSDGVTIRHDFKAADSDLRRDIDSDGITIRHDFKAADSDLRVDIDSDGITIRHDFKAADSDLRRDIDSDGITIRHDFKAADSDLRVDIDSDGVTIRHDFKAADSDLRVDIDSDSLTIRHDYKAADSDLRVDIDSDGITIRHDFKAADSDLRSDIDSDGLTIRHDFKAADSDIIADHDSDINVLTHAYKDADSDMTLGRLADVLIIDSDGNHKARGGFTLQFDSDEQKWVSKRPTVQVEQSVSRMVVDRFLAEKDQNRFVLSYYPSGDVSFIVNGVDYTRATTRQLNVVSYDSDIVGPALMDSDEVIITYVHPIDGPSNPAVETVIDQFIITGSEVDFTLSKTPVGEVAFSINGSVALPNSITRVGDSISYNSILNGNTVLTAGDKIVATYISSSVIPYTARLKDLNDVSARVPGHLDALAWDSDQNQWSTISVATAAYSSAYYVDKFTATAGQEIFMLSAIPNGMVSFSRNGMTLDVDAYVDSDAKVTYFPELNNNQVMNVDDEVIISYVSNGALAKLPKFGDIADVNVTNIEDTSFVQYDSEASEWVSVQFVEEEFVAIDNQMDFVLSYQPKTITGVYRNGLRLRRAAWKDSDGTIVYDKANNQDNPFMAGDDLQVTYFK